VFASSVPEWKRSKVTYSAKGCNQWSIKFGIRKYTGRVSKITENDWCDGLGHRDAEKVNRNYVTLLVCGRGILHHCDGRA